MATSLTCGLCPLSSPTATTRSPSILASCSPSVEMVATPKFSGRRLIGTEGLCSSTAMGSLYLVDSGEGDQLMILTNWRLLFIRTTKKWVVLIRNPFTLSISFLFLFLWKFLVCALEHVFGYFQLQLGVDESYTLFVAKDDRKSIIGEATIEVIWELQIVGFSFSGAIKLIECKFKLNFVIIWCFRGLLHFIYVLCRQSRVSVMLILCLLQANTVYGALRGLEVCRITLQSMQRDWQPCNFLAVLAFPLWVLSFMNFQTFSQLCAFDYGAKSVQVYKAPWYIRDKPRFAYRGLLLGRLNLFFVSGRIVP